MENSELVSLIRRIRAHEWSAVSEIVHDWHAQDLAVVMELVSGTDAGVLFRALPLDVQAEVFAHLEDDQQVELLDLLTDDETRHVMLRLEPDDRTQLLEDLPEELLARLLGLLPKKEVEEAEELLAWPEESIGRIMTPDFVELKAEMTAREAVRHIRKFGKDSETVHRLFVTDNDGRLVGSVRLRALVLADPESKIADIAEEDDGILQADADQEDAVKEMARTDTFVLPVVDQSGVMAGIVTADDVFDIAEEETTEDIQISAAVAPLETSYRRAGVGLLYQRRVWWLGSLIFVSLASSGVIAAFEDRLQETIALAFFIPILMATGGNTGSQSSTLMIRALATEEVRADEWAKTFGKEVIVGLALGATLGFLSAAIGIVRDGVGIAMVVGFTMVGLVLVANVLGMGLPFILERMKIDPAVASGPLITVVVDAIGLLIYFAMAGWLL